MIGSTSRFANCYPYTVLMPNGNAFTVLSRRFPMRTPKRGLHVDSNGEQRNDLVAQRAYGNSTLWWAIHDVNSTLNPMDLFKTEGESVLVPSSREVEDYLNHV